MLVAAGDDLAVQEFYRRLSDPLDRGEHAPYRVAWAQLLARVYQLDGRACPACPGALEQVGAVLPPQAATWIRTRRIYPVGALAPRNPQLPLTLPDAS